MIKIKFSTSGFIGIFFILLFQVFFVSKSVAQVKVPKKTKGTAPSLSDSQEMRMQKAWGKCLDPNVVKKIEIKFAGKDLFTKLNGMMNYVGMPISQLSRTAMVGWHRILGNLFSYTGTPRGKMIEEELLKDMRKAMKKRTQKDWPWVAACMAGCVARNIVDYEIFNPYTFYAPTSTIFDRGGGTCAEITNIIQKLSLNMGVTSHSFPIFLAPLSGVYQFLAGGNAVNVVSKSIFNHHMNSFKIEGKTYYFDYISDYSYSSEKKSYTCNFH